MQRHTSSRLGTLAVLARALVRPWTLRVHWAATTHVSTMTIQHLAAIAALRSDENGSSSHVDQVRAAHLLGFVDASDAVTGLAREYTEQQEYDSVLAALHNELGVDCLTKLMDEGRAWNEDQAVADALLV